LLVAHARPLDTPLAISHQKVEVVRAMYAAFAGRDRATLLSHLDPEMRVYDRPVHPEASIYEDREGFLRWQAGYQV
jgi:hypothetical protein